MLLGALSQTMNKLMVFQIPLFLRPRKLASRRYPAGSDGLLPGLMTLPALGLAWLIV